MIEGPINVASQLLIPRKDEVVHAVVAWRTTKELTLFAFASAPTAVADLAAFKEFFKEETQYYNATPQELPWEPACTPTRRHKKSIEDARKAATPEPWTKRNRN